MTQNIMFKKKEEKFASFKMVRIVKFHRCIYQENKLMIKWNGLLKSIQGNVKICLGIEIIIRNVNKITLQVRRNVRYTIFNK